MKFTLLENLLTLLEDRVDFAIAQSGKRVEDALKNDTAARGMTAEEAIKKMAEDVGSTYINWLARMYASRQFRMEDLSRIKSEVKKFEKVRSKLEVKDLNAYKNLSQLYDALEPFDEEDVISKKEADRKLKNEETEVFLKRPDILVVVPKTEAAAQKYGAGTKWCTAASKECMFKHYHDQGPIYIIMAKLDGEDRKFQLHYESNQFMDEKDRDVGKSDIDKLSKLDGYTEFLNMLIKKHYGD